jgi:hypothetical protein
MRAHLCLCLLVAGVSATGLPIYTRLAVALLVAIQAAHSELARQALALLTM